MVSLTNWERHANTSLLTHSTVAKALAPASIVRNCRAVGHHWRDSFWSPANTLLTFLLQVLDGAKTLRAAVALLLVQLAGRGQADLPSPDPSAYCQARRRLPLPVLTRLLRQLVRQMRPLVTDRTGWLGRRVWVLDGSSVSMPDTPELQKAFPQPAGQAPGCGFPVAQFVALFCWATGAIVDLAIDTLRPHELTLFRRLWHYFATGDVVLADRAYCSYVDMARLRARGVDCVLRLHHRRKSDFRQGRSLGTDDRLVTWRRPERWLPSCGLSRQAFEHLPETLVIRLVRISDTPRGFRSQTIVVVTTLVDPVQTPAEEIRALYRDRWTIELNLRSIKIGLGMDILRGQSVDVVHKEIAMHLLAYNLIRLLMWQAARVHGRDLHRLSFVGTLHRLRAVLPLLLARRGQRLAVALLECLLDWIATDLVPCRPDRVEPRRVKRRPKQYSRLNKPRQWYHHHPDTTGR